jgi:amidohydrolase
MAHVITALQTIVSRNVSPIDTAVVTVTRVQCGDAYNIIPQQVALAGTIRTFRKEVREIVVTRFQQIVDQTARALGCEAKVEIRQLSLPVINDADIAAQLKAGFQQVAPDLKYPSHVMTMAAEDMAYFLERVPGVYFFVGSANAARALDYPHHHPRFDFDEEALVTGSALLASAVSAYVLPD